MKQLTTTEKYYQFLVGISKKRQIEWTKEYNKWKLCRTTGAVLKDMQLVKKNKWTGIIPTLEMAQTVIMQLRKRKRGQKENKQSELSFGPQTGKNIVVVKKPTEQECIEYLKATGKYKIYKITTEEI